MQPSRWEKNGEYVEIEPNMHVDGGHVFAVNSSLPFTNLPVEFRKSVQNSDEAAVSKLRSAVENWARQNGFSPAPKAPDQRSLDKN